MPTPKLYVFDSLTTSSFCFRKNCWIASESVLFSQSSMTLQNLEFRFVKFLHCDNTIFILRSSYTCNFFLVPTTQQVKLHCVTRVSDKIACVTYPAQQRNCNLILSAIIAESWNALTFGNDCRKYRITKAFFVITLFCGTPRINNTEALSIKTRPKMSL